MTAAKAKTLDDLRTPFGPAVIGKLPRKTPNGGTIQLDFVGHAAVTDRLLTVDPAWSWEPVALDETGLPLYDRNGGLWIRLTVLGVTRLGYGDGPDPKQRIGDAIRNAAMRFGVALDLWTKGELESQDPNGGGGDVVRHGGVVDSYSDRPAQRAPGNPSEVTPWSEPVRQPPKTDEAWLKEWEAQVGRATTKEHWQQAWHALTAAVKANRLTPADADSCKQLWQDALKEQTETDALREANDQANHDDAKAAS